MNCADDVIERHPVPAVAVLVVVGAVTYAGISVVIRGGVDPVETGLFAVLFGVIYVGAAVYSDAIEKRLGSR